MLEAALRHEGFDVHAGVVGTRRARRASTTQSTRPDRARRDAARPRRLRGVPASAQRRRADAGPVPHRPRRDRRQGARPHPRRRRLPGEAVQPRGARGPHQRGAAPLGPRATPTRCCGCADLELDDDAHRSCAGPASRCRSRRPSTTSCASCSLNQGRVLSKAQILDHVWQYDFGGDGGVVETYIGYLRKKVDHVEPAADPHGAGRRVRAAGSVVQDAVERVRTPDAPASPRSVASCSLVLGRGRRRRDRRGAHLTRRRT